MKIVDGHENAEGSRFRKPRAPTDPAFADLLLTSFERLVGRPLVDTAAGERSDAGWLYKEAPFCLLAHDTRDDPHIVYANRTAQACFEYDWATVRTLPSRLSAEAPIREQRQQLLDAVARDGYVTGYSGVRIAKSGRRFRIENTTIWELIDRDGVRHGQAAVFRSWRDVEPVDG